jgi:hypothetical protein
MIEKKDFSHRNIVGSKILGAKSKEEDLENFVKRWNLKIEEIKKIGLDNSQSGNLVNFFLEEWDKFILKKYGEKEVKNGGLILNQLSGDLMLSLMIANNNYRFQYPSFWRIFIPNLKLPDIVLKI